jgi:hypothetical protein
MGRALLSVLLAFLGACTKILGIPSEGELEGFETMCLCPPFSQYDTGTPDCKARFEAFVAEDSNVAFLRDNDCGQCTDPESGDDPVADCYAPIGSAEGESCELNYECGSLACCDDDDTDAGACCPECFACNAFLAGGTPGAICQESVATALALCTCITAAAFFPQPIGLVQPVESCRAEGFCAGQDQCGQFDSECLACLYRVSICLAGAGSCGDGVCAACLTDGPTHPPDACIECVEDTQAGCTSQYRACGNDAG